MTLYTLDMMRPIVGEFVGPFVGHVARMFSVHLQTFEEYT